MPRSISFKGVIIGIVAFFIVLMVVVYVVAERTEARMDPQSQTHQNSR